MEMLEIEGGFALKGEVYISGSKNAALPVLIATLLSEKTSFIKNVPVLADTKFLFDLLRSFGSECEVNGREARISNKKINNPHAHYDVVRKMRASVLVLAPLLARCGEAVVSLPGGCAIGGRPVDIHLDGLTKLGAQIEVKEGYIHAKLKTGTFVGARFDLPLPSVGATENLVMAAVLAKGQTILNNVAKEPEVVELCHALVAAGARIDGLGSSTLTIDGVSSINALEHRVTSDRIEAGTFIALAAATKSEISLIGVCIDAMASIIERFEMAGVKFIVDEPNILKVKPADRSCATDVETAAFPGFPTDMQAQFMTAMAVAEGTSHICERIFENRFMHVPELRRMGAEIHLSNGVARIVGKKTLSAAPVMATDLRASAGLVIAALVARGKSEIRRIYHLDRGYEKIDEKLIKLGARVNRSSQ